MTGRNGDHRERRDDERRTRTLVIIGGHEDRTGEKRILCEVARRAGPGKLVVTTVASHEPEGAFEEYERAFHDLGVKEVALLEIRDRGEALGQEAEQTLEDATGVFFTGGDQ